MEIDERKKVSNWGRQESKPISKISCFICKGNHKANVCPRKSHPIPGKPILKKDNWSSGRTDVSRNGGNAAAASSSSFGRNNGGGRAPLTGHNLRTDPRKTVRYSDAGKSVESKIGEKRHAICLSVCLSVCLSKVSPHLWTLLAERRGGGELLEVGTRGSHSGSNFPAHREPHGIHL